LRLNVCTRWTRRRRKSRNVRPWNFAR